MVTTIKKIHAYEQLDALEKITNDVEKALLLKEYGSKPPLNFILSLNFNHGIKLDIPEGMPPMLVKDMDQLTHPDFQGLLAAGIHRLRHCTDKSDLKKFKKEAMFYDVLINCPMKDAEILCSAKDGALTELYPSITADFVKAVFPSYVKEAAEVPNVSK